ncbi:calcium/sodium antiporter [Pseudoblastomonas halimionae]|uniref:Calcium/sodium antiporter n=1 Tax=Alteriqipengyuania halimionae TaxID=1926630 RepID=A0A6I4U2Y3_9SPHN|nr:calcium/sodium antiporter [Alteriqipengyuania halimionae]MXP09313.1 calcium/sodium antiporter [Alteriqipengyuania halimionae]
MTGTILFLLLGFALLVGGGELLVRGAVRLAERLGLSSMLIGLTVVGLGTSMPELAASVQAALAGSPGIALGNIVGSNLANTLLILGTAALIAPVMVERSVLWRDGLVGLGGVLLLMLAGQTLGLDRVVGIGFLAVLAAYIWFAFHQEKTGVHGAAGDRVLAVEGTHPDFHVEEEPRGSMWTAVALFLAGLVLIVAGGTVLIDAAVKIAGHLGVSDTVIGLTIVAAGTSFPELVTTVIAALRKQSDLALGNVLGSNIYNIFFIGGVTGIVAPGPIPLPILSFDLWVLVGASVVAMVFAFTGGRLGRWEGGALVLAYTLFILFTADLIRL